MSFDFPTEILEEGCVRFLAPRLGAFKEAAWEYAPSKAPVFYNPVMKLNRDLAVLALQAYQRMVDREVVVCEPLAGCGVRGIRFAREVEGVERVVLNDINPAAADLAGRSVELNQVSDRVLVFNEEANLLLARYAAPSRRFDSIDIDPFGSPVGYMDSALRAIRDGGLIALTATDMAPLCGVYPQVALRRYGGRSLRTEYCHELAARLLCGCLATMAARHDIGVRLLFSHSSDHYVRAYAMLDFGAKKADEGIRKMGYILHCFNCFHRETYGGFTPSFQNRCEECGSRLNVAGPLWLGEILDGGFCLSMKKEATSKPTNGTKRVMRLLSLIHEECDAPPTYYVVSKICDKFNLPVPRLSDVIAETERAGFKSVLTHLSPMGFRTVAPASVVTEIVRKLGRHRPQAQ